ncbi:MAG: NAD(P)/FAD-dependent oxidoreductase [Panacagrimonas sp.]
MVGAGVIGLSTALELVLLGLRVTVIDRSAVGRGGASWAGGGILCPLAPADVDPSTVPLLRESLQMYGQWCEELQDQGHVNPEFTISGMQIQAPSPAAPWHEFGPRCGIEVTEPPDDMRRDSPFAVAWLPRVAQVRSPRLLKVLAAAVRARGGTVIEGEDITQLQGGPERVTGVISTRDVRRCGFVVVASGAWTDALVPDAGIRPVKGQMLLLQGSVGELQNILLMGDRYLIPRRDGLILAGSTVEEAGFDDAPTEQGREALLNAIHQHFPGFANHSVIAHWAGLRPAPAGLVPRIGKDESRRGLVFNTGHHRLGITLAPASARVVSAQIARTGF